METATYQLTQAQSQDILKALGKDALNAITNGRPEYVPELDLIVFWYRGLECEYYFHTEPVLLRLTETDMEFTSFDQLCEEIL